MKKVLLYCICWLSAGTAAAQAIDGITGASTRVLAPADTLITIDSTYMEVRSPGHTIESTGDAGVSPAVMSGCAGVPACLTTGVYDTRIKLNSFV